MYRPMMASTAEVWRRKLKLKAKFESSLSYYSFKRLDPGAFNVGFIGSTCTALPRGPRARTRRTRRPPGGSNRSTTRPKSEHDFASGKCSYRHADKSEDSFVDSTSVECLLSITPLPSMMHTHARQNTRFSLSSSRALGLTDVALHVIQRIVNPRFLR